MIDDRPDYVTRELYPTADTLICDSYENLHRHLKEDACYVVVTPGHRADYQCVCHILPTAFRYLGMIGSRNKVATTFEKMRQDGFSDAQLAQIHAPIGLSIGAQTPAEIAVSILAQIIQEKNKTHVASADRDLLGSKAPGMLCLITHKQGSAPRGVGSMMLITADGILGSIGGGAAEYRAIEEAKDIHTPTFRTYDLSAGQKGNLDMVCGGTVDVLFLPI